MPYCFGAGMMLNEEKRDRLADALARRQGALGVVGDSAPSAPISTHTAPSPAPSAPIVAVRASPAPTPFEKDKRVVEIESDGDEDTVEGPIFKRRRAVVATTYHSTNVGRPGLFRDHPPSASSPHDLLVVEGVVRAPLDMSKLHPPPSFPLSFKIPSKASKEGQRKTWTRTR